ncbi:hypothetical protein V8C43DRAFT_294791 [Trichoderma afarasin]
MIAFVFTGSLLLCRSIKSFMILNFAFKVAASTIASVIYIFNVITGPVEEGASTSQSNDPARRFKHSSSSWTYSLVPLNKPVDVCFFSLLSPRLS